MGFCKWRTQLRIHRALLFNGDISVIGVVSAFCNRAIIQSGAMAVTLSVVDVMADHVILGHGR